MLSVEQCEEMINIDKLNYDTVFTLDCQFNTLEIPCLKRVIQLNETQKRLLFCLINKINKKREIINVVWYENHQCIRDNNYHQLVFQLRALFQRNQLPGNILITVPYYGLKLNQQLLKKIEADAASNCLAAPEIPESCESAIKNKLPSLRAWFLNALR